MPNKSQASSDKTEKLQKQLIDLNQTKKELESIMSKLQESLGDIDKMLSKNFETWQEHREKYFNNLTEQLAKPEGHNIILTNEEKAELRRGSSTASSIKEKLENLEEKFKIKIPNKASDFAIIVHDTVVAASSRTLQKIDNDSIKDIVKHLPVINEENTDSTKIKVQYKNQYEEITKKTRELQNKVTSANILSDDQLELIEQLKKTALTAPKPTTHKPEAEEAKIH